MPGRGRDTTAALRRRRFFFNDTATTEIYTLSLHDALPISNGHSNSVPEGLTPVLVQVANARSEEHTSELQSLRHLVCRLLLEKKPSKRHGKVMQTQSHALVCPWAPLRRHPQSHFQVPLFFFLMIRRPPRSTLFPTRRSSD